MSKVVDISCEEQRYREASRWIAKLDKSLSDEERKTLLEWMEDPRNEALLLEMAALWDGMNALSRLRDLFPKPAKPAFGSRLRVRAATAAVAVASVVVGLLASYVWLSNGSGTTDALAGRSASDVYETAVGEQSTVILVDGTEMTLNTNSHVVVSYTDRRRMLRLTRGEIHVDVAKDVNRPLTVLARDRVVQAVGTAFGVDIASRRRVELIVTSGTVLVDVHDAAIEEQRGIPILAFPSSVAVTAGQTFVAEEGEGVITAASDEELDAKLSWRDGSLTFRGEPLEEALTEVSRYTTVEFVILEDELKQERISGRFRVGDIERLMTALQLNFDIRYRWIGDERMLLSRAPASRPGRESTR